MKRVAAITVMFLFVAASAFAGSYEDGVKAYDNNEYKKAFGIFSKLAVKGDVRPCLYV